MVGGGNSGLQEGLFLTRFAKKVTVLEVGERPGGSQVLQDKVIGHPAMAVRLQTMVEEFKGEGRLSGVVVRDLKSGQTEELHPDGVFVFIGLLPNTGFLQDTLNLDRWGFIETSNSLETSVKGIFAAGDARQGSTKQVQGLFIFSK